MPAAPPRTTLDVVRPGTPNDEHPQGHSGGPAPRRLLAPARCLLPRGPRVWKRSPPGRDGAALGAALDELIGIAHAHLRNALAYTLAIPARETGIRRFCLWALGLAVLTLRKIHHNPAFLAGRQVKVSRRTVRATVITTSARRSRRLDPLPAVRPIRGGVAAGRRLVSAGPGRGRRTMTVPIYRDRLDTTPTTFAAISIGMMHESHVTVLTEAAGMFTPASKPSTETLPATPHWSARSTAHALAPRSTRAAAALTHSASA